jgi:DNA-binding winged helix-turn-helix (wHTH) protein/tetratricopeptide (TPR) repeat protein
MIQSPRLHVDFDSYTLNVDGQAVRLTKTEWLLLRMLAQHSGQVLTYRALLQRVWGDAYGNETDYIHTYVRRLRRKLGDAQLIHTESGIGYRFVLPADQVAADTTTRATQPQSTARWLNMLPPDAGARFTGRAAERAAIAQLVHDRARLVGIYGRAGVGKTTLTARALQDVAAEFDGGVVYSAETDFARVFHALKQLAHAHAAPVGDTLISADNLQQQMASVLEALKGGRYLLLIDNIEVMQEDNGELRNPLFSRLIELALSIGGLQMIVTSRIPLRLPLAVKSWARTVSLTDGLDLADSIQLLRLCDPDDAAGLASADDALLAQLATRGGGYPRALEAVVGLLLENPLLTPQQVLDGGMIESLLVQDALHRLNSDGQAVMNALAVLGRPEPHAALAALLPDLPAAQLTATLERLIRAFFVRYERSRATFAIHEIDRKLCYQALDTAQRDALHGRAAAYYQAPDTADLLRAGEHLIAAGEDAAAVALLLTLQEGDALPLLERALPRVPHLRFPILLRKANAYRALGIADQALPLYNDLYDSEAAAPARAEVLAQRAWAHYDLGALDTALNDWHAAAMLYQQLGNRVGVGKVAGGQGWVSYLRGAYDEAEAHFERALFELSEARDLTEIGNNLGDLGQTYYAQGNLIKGARVLREALMIVQTVGSASEQSYKGGYLAAAYLALDDLPAAQRTIEAARAHNVPANEASLATLEGVIAYRRGDTVAAAEAFHDAIYSAEERLRYNPDAYLPRYVLGLAHAGLAQTDDGPITTAAQVFATARARCDADGLRAQYRALLRMIDIESAAVGL